MQSRGIFQNISPLDHRYSLSRSRAVRPAERHPRRRGAIRYCLAGGARPAESAARRAFLRGLRSPGVRRGSTRPLPQITPEEVYEEEARTQHNVRALVNVLKRHLPEEVRPFVHLGATSVDILDTAAALRYRDAVRPRDPPLPPRPGGELIRRAREESETAADRPHARPARRPHHLRVRPGGIRRPAGQEHPAHPREGRGAARKARRRGRRLQRHLPPREGPRAAGARVSRSASVLQPSEHSTQLVEPEYLLGLLLELNTAFGIIANLADDLRNLQRSEIGEVREEFTETQVGSSTMPQKRNPWNSEHVKSLWKAFCPARAHLLHGPDLRAPEGPHELGFLAIRRRIPRRVRLRRRTDALRGPFPGGRQAEDGGKPCAARGARFSPSRSTCSSPWAGMRDAHERVRAATLKAEQTGATALRRAAQGRRALGRAESAACRDPRAGCARPSLPTLPTTGESRCSGRALSRMPTHKPRRAFGRSWRR